MDNHFYRPSQKDGDSGEELQFPVTYMLKVVMDTIQPAETNIHILEGVFAHLGIRYASIGEKQSRTGKYTSYSVEVTVSDRTTFAALYRELARVPTVKTAI